MNPYQRIGFPILTAICIFIGVLVFLLSDQSHLLPASIFLFLTSSVALQLITVIPASYGRMWLLVVVYITGVCYGCSAFLLTMVFPYNRLRTQWGQWLVSGGLAANSACILAYAWTLFTDVALYDTVRTLSVSMMIFNMIGSCVLVLVVPWRAWTYCQATRHALGLMVLGTIGALAPLCFLTLVPLALNQSYSNPKLVVNFSMSCLAFGSV
jgi:hypothetical protein